MVYIINEKIINLATKDGAIRTFDASFLTHICIIDMDYVMHGSYNWTPTANNNDETLATALDHDLVAKFASEFMLMYNE